MRSRAAPLLELRGIGKRFPGVMALDRVHLTVRRGEVHLLLGENGAGKSTLMKILAGAHPRDAGEIRLGGRPVEIPTPLAARRLGIAMIHQETMLVPHLTAAENIFLGREPARLGFIRRAAMERAAGVLLRRLGAAFPPSARVTDLAVAQQQLVEISRALSLDARLIIMDEPTSPLTGRETTALFRVIRSLRREGVSIIYITHRLDEARAIGDTVTVLRDGRLAGTGPLRRMSDQRLVTLMVGRRIARLFPPLPRPGTREALGVQALARPGAYGPVTLRIRRGEILGLAGLIGSGRTELARGLIGAERPATGTVTLAGVPFIPTSPAAARRRGLVLLPEDRKAQGLVLGLSVLHNGSLTSLDRLSRWGFMRSRAERRLVGGLVSRLRVRTPGLDQAARNLSGGNQQKLVLAKWLAVSPRVIIFDEPTRGIDVGARSEVYRLITGLARRGAGILLISSDLTEVLGLAHRVAVMRAGRIVADLPRARATPRTVMRHAMGLAAR